MARGAVLGYTATATNTTASQQCINYWENVNLPGGALYPANGSLLNPIPYLCLNGGASKVVHLSRGVPVSAPLGAYIFNDYVGAYSFPALPFAVDEAHFNFDVVAPVAPLSVVPHTSWRLLENGF